MVGEGGMDGGRGWAGGGGLNLPLGLFGLAVVQEVPAIESNMFRGLERCLTTDG